MGVQVRGYLRARRDRALGTILGYAEREIWSRLSADEQDRFRRTVLDAIQSYHDSTLDLFKAETDVVRNDQVIALMERLERQMQALSRSRTSGPAPAKQN